MGETRMKNLNCMSSKTILVFMLAFIAMDSHANEGDSPSSEKSVHDSVLKQPVFILCPHKAGYSAWMIYVETDREDPAKLKSVCLESLKKVNSIDHRYEEIIDFVANPKTAREQLDKLPADRFSGGSLNINKNDALHISLTPIGNDYQLNLNMRVGATDHFIIGGKERAKRFIVLHYDPEEKLWSACATHLEDAEGKTVVKSGYEPMYGMYFPVTFTGIYRVVGVFKTGEAAILMDR